MPWMWVDALQQRDAVWQEFKDDLTALRQFELERLLTVSPTERDVQMGIVKGIQRVLLRATTTEREAHARASRSQRESNFSSETRTYEN